MTPETAGLGIGYRWSSLAGTEAGTKATTSSGAPLAGDRAPDAPCRDAATGERTHLYGTFAGPHTTVLGFGPTSASVLREVTAYGAGVRACRVYAAHEDPGTPQPGAVVDDQGHAAAAYGIGAGGSGLVVVRPDHHVGVVAPAGDPGSVREYLRRMHGAPGMVDAVR